jgi:hypothetical protein
MTYAQHSFRIAFAFACVGWLTWLVFDLSASRTDARITKIADLCEYSKVPEERWNDRRGSARKRADASHPRQFRECTSLTIPFDLEAKGYDKARLHVEVTVSYHTGKTVAAGKLRYTPSDRKRLSEQMLADQPIRIAFNKWKVEEASFARRLTIFAGLILALIAVVDTLAEAYGKRTFRQFSAWWYRTFGWPKRRQQRKKNTDFVDRSTRSN